MDFSAWVCEAAALRGTACTLQFRGKAVVPTAGDDKFVDHECIMFEADAEGPKEEAEAESPVVETPQEVAEAIATTTMMESAAEEAPVEAPHKEVAVEVAAEAQKEEAAAEAARAGYQCWCGNAYTPIPGGHCEGCGWRRPLPQKGRGGGRGRRQDESVRG